MEMHNIMRFIIRSNEFEMIGNKVGSISVITEIYMTALRRPSPENGNRSQVVYESLDADIHMVHTEDFDAACVYIDLSGKDSESIIPVIREKLKSWSPEEVLINDGEQK